MYTVTPLVCALATAPKALLLRNTGWSEQVRIASVAWLLRGPAGTVLIDTSLGGAWDDPVFEPVRASLGMWRIQGGGILGQLGALGLGPQDVDLVLLTHLHTDHIASLPAFGASRVVLSRTGWTRARSERHPWLNTYSPQILAWMETSGVELHLVDDTDRIAGGIGFRWMGGHSPCSQAVIVDTKVGRTAFAGDLVPLAENWQTGIPTGHYQNIREVADAYEYLSGFDAVVPGHDPEQPDWMEVAA